jgi:cysteine desulfurase
MMPCFQEVYGNPSSLHSFGRAAKSAVRQARDKMAEILSCQPRELVFTSGGTESDNTALFGIFFAHYGRRPHVITSRIEHHAVLDACRQLEAMGCDVTYVSPDSTGRVAVRDIERAIRPETVLISIMYGNNETGTIQPVAEIGEMARERGVVFHVDAVQALGSVELKLSEIPVDLMSFSAHKINGPKGIGALYVSSRAQIKPYMYGGKQESRRRAGTENVAGIVGFARALEIAAERRNEKRREAEHLRRTMLGTFAEMLGTDGYVVNGNEDFRLPHILNVSFPGTDTETLLMNLDLEGVAAASGSACSSGSLEASHVLQAMNLPEDVLRSAVRFSFGLGNTAEEVRLAAVKCATIVKRLRNK